MKNQKEPKFISLMNDITFKTLWMKGSVETKEYLSRIISNIINIDVRKYHLSSNELGILNYKSMANKVDILLIDKDNRKKINIELNYEYSEYLERKNDIYIHKLAGETYARLKEDDKYSFDIDVIQVNLNNYYNKINRNITSNYYVLADPINNIVKKGITIYHMHIPKIKEMCYDGCSELYQDLIMFEAKSYEEMKNMIKGNKERQKVMEDLQKLGSDTEFVDLYDHEEFERILRKAQKEEAMEEARKEGLAKGIEQGLKQGIEQGIEQGLKQGIEQGIEQGREEGREEGKIESAKKLIESGMPKKEVATILGIDINKI